MSHQEVSHRLTFVMLCQGDVDMQDLASMRAAMKAMEAQLAEIRSQREVVEAEQVSRCPLSQH